MERDSSEPIHQTTGNEARTNARASRSSLRLACLDLRKELIKRRHDSQAQVRRTGCLNRAERRNVGPAVLGFKKLLRIAALPPRRQRNTDIDGLDLIEPRQVRSGVRGPGFHELGHPRMGDQSTAVVEEEDHT